MPAGKHQRQSDREQNAAKEKPLAEGQEHAQKIAGDQPVQQQAEQQAPRAE